jgi:glycosyltransferase involved in cell wall biosynthesis
MKQLVQRLLPPPLLRPAKAAHYRFDIVRTALRQRRPGRYPALASFAPLFEPGAFVPRRVVMTNSSLLAGGAERHLVQTVEVLGRVPLESLAVVLEYLDEDRRYAFYRDRIRPGVEVSRLGTAPDSGERISARLAPVAAYLRRFAPDLAALAWRFVAEFSRRRPQIVHVWQDYYAATAGIAAVIVGVPDIILSGENLIPDRLPYRRPDFYHAYRILLDCERTRFVNNSRAGCTDYARWLAVAPDRFGFFPNALDELAIARAAPERTAAYRAQLGIPATAPIIGGVFRLNPEKDPLLWVDTMAEIARRRPDAHFLLVGEGPLRAAVEARIGGTGLDRRFRLPGTTGDVALSLSAMDVFLLTSRCEGSPNVLLEAGLLGLPIVSTDAGGARETFCDGRNGYLVAGRDPRTIVRHILAVLDSPGFARQAALEGPAFVRRHFSIDGLYRATRALYRL